MKEFIDDTELEEGTDINRANMLAAQGFQSKTTIFSGNSIIETNGDGEVLTTTFNQDGTISEVFEGEKTITKTTSFSGNAVIETLS